jgi:AcrR family transcriptional regulator
MDDEHWSTYSHDPLPPILQACLHCFVEHGYHGTTMRQLSGAAGLSVPGLYHHYDSKQAILVQLMSAAMSDLYARSAAALAEAGPSTAAQLQLHIECLVLFHAHRRDLAFIAANEIRSLDEEGRRRHIAARDRQQRVLDDIIAAGVAAGAFHTDFAADVSRAIVTMCTGVAQWFREKGPLDATVVAERYVDLARRMLGTRD